MLKVRGDRLRILALCILAVLGVLWLRGAHLTVVRFDDLSNQADKQQKKLIPIPSLRGPILARGGEPLAFSVEGSSLALDPHVLEDQDQDRLSTALEEHGIMDRSDFRELLASCGDRRFIWLNRKPIPEAVAHQLEEEFGPALILLPEPKRLYLLGSAGVTLVGVTGTDGDGLIGIEARYEGLLHGTDGRMIDFRSGHTRMHSGPGRIVLTAPKIGSTVELTIDARFQEIVDTHLEVAVREQRARGGAAILCDPHTGEILALSSKPGFDPDSVSSADSLALCNWAITVNYEPGSTYKIVPYAAALEAGSIDPTDWIECHNGSRRVPGGIIRDHEPYDSLQVWEAFAKSSNIAAGVVAERVGEEPFYRTERLFGFGVPTGLGLSGEERGSIPDPSSWSRRSLVTQAFGQEISCTMMQLAMAYGAVANGGLLVKPYVVREVRNSDGTVTSRQSPEIVRRAMSPETARTLRELMRMVVTDGTGSMAEIEGLRPAGKTGTAQKFIRELSTYSNERYIASFAGFAPYDSPRWVCMVVLDEPRASIWGGSVAAPVFRRILEDVAQIEIRAAEKPIQVMQVTPAEIEPVAVVPRIEGLSRGLVRELIKQEGLRPCFIGRGERVVSSDPPSGSLCRPGERIDLLLGGEENEPDRSDRLGDFIGLPLRDAVVRARWYDFPFEVRGSGWVVGQTPAPNTPIDKVDRLLLQLSPDSCAALAEWVREGR